jgi:hypothetical protein
MKGALLAALVAMGARSLSPVADLGMVGSIGFRLNDQKFGASYAPPNLPETFKVQGGNIRHPAREAKNLAEAGGRRHILVDRGGTHSGKILPRRHA